MKLSNYIDEERGRGRALALRISAPIESVSQWKSGVRPAPADRCPDIESATDGLVTCEELRPDVRWQRVPDADWPHPNGRPCIDVARPAREVQQA